MKPKTRPKAPSPQDAAAVLREIATLQDEAAAAAMRAAVAHLGLAQRLEALAHALPPHRRIVY